MPRRANSTIVTINEPLVEPLKLKADELYYDLPGLVNYVLRMYLLGEIAVGMPTANSSKPAPAAPVNREQNVLEESASELPDAIADIDLAD